MRNDHTNLSILTYIVNGIVEQLSCFPRLVQLVVHYRPDVGLGTAPVHLDGIYSAVVGKHRHWEGRCTI